MKSVRDLCVDAMSLKVNGLSPEEVKQRIMDSGRDNGLWPIEVTQSGAMIDLRFPNGEMMHFDGSSWSHSRP